MTEKLYRWDATDYQKHSCAQLGWAQELVEKMKLVGDESILDIGCGDGKVTAELAARAPRGRVVGIDNSAEMIALAKKSFPPIHFSNLTFVVMDASILDFDAQFDVVFSNAALNWVRDHAPVLQGIFDGLKPGGRVLLQMGGKGNAEALIAVLQDMATSSQWSQFLKDMEFPYGFHSAEDYTQWLENAGLIPIRVELIPKKMLQKERDGLAGWIRTTWLPYTERIPVEKREAFIADLCAAYLKDYPLDEKDNACVQMVRLEVQAQKPE